MIFEQTGLAGLLIVKPHKHVDQRGFFARLWCADEFEEGGAAFSPKQISTSFSRIAGTLRGLHWQGDPYGETKLVRATRGKVWDVAVDLRSRSSTRLSWFGLELNSTEHTAMLIPSGFAHGFVTLTDDAEVEYNIDTKYRADAALGARFDDPAIGIVWPCKPVLIGRRDLEWPALCPR